jgi:hypothetical protein
VGILLGLSKIGVTAALINTNLTYRKDTCQKNERHKCFYQIVKNPLEELVKNNIHSITILKYYVNYH